MPEMSQKMRWQRQWPGSASFVRLSDFAGTHASALALADALPALAAAIEATPRERWTEALLEQFRKKSGLSMPTRARLKMMFFRSQQSHRRLGVERGDVPISSQALEFASGRLCLGPLPGSPLTPILKSFDATKVNQSALDIPQGEEHFIHEQRRKAAGGLRAEEAVLAVCVADALKWFREEPQAFRDALAIPLEFLGDEGKRRAESLTNEEQMRKLLHVADYVGNAGFDVLVPRDGTFLQVEVKRVSQASNGRFFVSENERRRALDYRKRSIDWRLWLITNDGKSQDVSNLMDVFDKHQSALQNLAEDGLRPGEWMFILNQ